MTKFRNSPKSKEKIHPGKIWDVKAMLKTTLVGVKTKINGALVLGDITPRTKSNLLETFVSYRYSNFFINNSAKKPKSKENSSQKVLKREKCLKWRTRGVKTKNVKQNKSALGLGDFTPRTKSNLLETFVSNRHSKFFSYKNAKKLLFTHGYYCIKCLVNMHCSRTTYSHFSIKH